MDNNILVRHRFIYDKNDKKGLKGATEERFFLSSVNKIMKIISAVLIILKDISQRACVYFTSLILIFNIISVPLAATQTGAQLRLNVEGWLTPALIFMFAAAAFLAGAATQVYKITKIPVFSRHIVFFILNYGVFIAVVLPMSNHQVNQGTTLLLSIAFIIIYLIIFGIYMGIKSALKSADNKKLEYDEVYKK